MIFLSTAVVTLDEFGCNDNGFERYVIQLNVDR